MRALLLIIVFMLTACSSSKLVSDWKSPDNPVFEANKVLVIGLTADREVRRDFESMLTYQLNKHEMIAVRSIDFFEDNFTDNRRSESELNELEQQLLDAGFDAILLSKVTGSEDKRTDVQSVRDFSDTFSNFKEDYYSSQEVFYTENAYEEYTVHHTEATLYCICPGKARELIWQGDIHVVDHNTKKNMTDYVNLLVKTLEERQVLIVDP